jgi:phage terminase small subunit
LDLGADLVSAEANLLRKLNPSLPAKCGLFYFWAMPLTAKQQRFVDEYLIDLNATAAYKRAGYAGEGNSAEAAASRLLSNVKVSWAIQAAMKEREKRTEITQDRVLQEYAKLAFLDPRRFYNEKGNLIPVHELDADVAAALAGMEIVTQRAGKDEDGNQEYEDVKKIKFIDKKGALDSVARHLGMFNDKVALTGKDGGSIDMNWTINFVNPAGER